jgi:chaperonin GroEL (HSP60 family)
MLEFAKKSRKQLMIFASSVNQNILSTLIYNKRKNIVDACAIDIPSHGTIGQKYIDMIS